MDLLAQLFPEIVGDAARAVLVQPLELPVLQRVAAIGSSTARMMSAMRRSPAGRARR